MSIVSSQFNMSSSNLLRSINVADSSLNRKRYIEDLDVFEENKRARTAPPSPPLAPAFRRRSLSPTPPTNLFLKPIIPLSPPQNSIRSIDSPTASKTALPSIESITDQVTSFKYLKQNNRYGNSHHSLDYPDTCVNDEGWRMNLEVWIEKNFPEKFNNLKNFLRFDKPGFDLLNDAILLNELKEQLDHERRYRKPLFTSKISKKMVSKKSSHNSHYYQRRVQSDHSDDESPAIQFQQSPSLKSWYHQHSSPISQPAIVSVQSSNAKSPYGSNYTYVSTEHTSGPSSPVASSLTSTLRRPSFSTIKLAPLTATPTSGTSIHSITTPPSASSSAPWKGHHKLSEGQVILESNTFIHTQNHKGPNHTYTIHHHNQSKRVCASCGSDQSPCWRPSWSTAAGQLCNSCGLRYKKTGARCTVDTCRRIPAKGEWTAMKSRGKFQVVDGEGHSHMGYSCLHCGGEVEVKDKSK